VFADGHAEFVGVEIQFLFRWGYSRGRHAPVIVGKSSRNAQRVKDCQTFDYRIPAACGFAS
jgi:hypothetical protein